MKYLSLNLPGNYSVEPIAGMPEGGIGILVKVIRWGITALIIISIVLALIFLILGGIQWITSGGDKARIDTARKRIIFTIAGLVLVFLSYFIINFIGDIFGVDLL